MAPAVEPPVPAGGASWQAAVVDAGSGIDAATVRVWVDTRPVPARTLPSGVVAFDVPTALAGELEARPAGSPIDSPPMRLVAIEVADRVGNPTRLETRIAGATLPAEPTLGRAFPNLFNPAVRIPFALPAGTTGTVRLAVWNVAGQRVRLLDDAVPAGPHESTWDGRDEEGRRLASGVYLVELKAAGHRRWTRVALLR